MKTPADENRFLHDGAVRLANGIEEERKAKLRAITEKLETEQDPEERERLIQLYGEVMRASDEELRKIDDYYLF